MESSSWKQASKLATPPTSSSESPLFPIQQDHPLSKNSRPWASTLFLYVDSPPLSLFSFSILFFVSIFGNVVKNKTVVLWGCYSQGDLYDHKSLVEAIKKVDVVISTVGHVLLAEQYRIIAAIKEAGNVKVHQKLFISSSLTIFF